MFKKLFLGFWLLSATFSCYAFDIPKLNSDASGWTLEIPYLEYNIAGYGKLVYSVNLVSQDNITYFIEFNSVREIPEEIGAANAPQLIAQASGWIFSLPAVLQGSGIFAKVEQMCLSTTDAVNIQLNGSLCSSSSCSSRTILANCPNLSEFQIENNTVQASPGDGYDEKRDHIKVASCLNGETRDVVNGKNVGSLLNDQITSYAELYKKLDRTKTVGGDLSVKAFGVKVGLGGSKVDQFISTVTKTNLSQSFVYNVEILDSNREFKVDLSLDNVLNTQAQSLINNPCQFKQVCGDNFLYQIERGAGLYVALTFKFSSTSHETEFNKNVSFKFGASIKSLPDQLKKIPLPDLNANWSDISNNFTQSLKKDTQLTISVIQLGGDTKLLPQILTSGADGAYTATCSLDESMEACGNIIQSIANYASNQFASGITGDNLYALNYLYSPYSAVGVFTDLSEDVSQEGMKAIEDAKAELLVEYQNRVVALPKINNLLQYSLHPDRETKLLQLYQSLSNDIVNIQEAAKTCFSDLSQCLTDKCAVMDSLTTGYSLEELELGYRQDDGLLLHLPFELNAEDASWYKNHGEIREGLLTYTDGISGYAASFDKNTIINIPNTEPFKFSNSSFTFSAWVTIPSNDANRAIISLSDKITRRLDLAKSGTGSDTYKGKIYMQIYFKNKGHARPLSRLTGSQLPKNVWLFVVGVADQEKGFVTLYIDGAKQNDMNIIDFDLSNPKLTIGGYSHNEDHTSNYYGLMDEVRIWERALSEQEIVQLYNEGKQ